VTDLPSALGDLASAVAWAEPGDLVADVRARIATPAPRRTRRRVAVAALAAAVAAVLGLTPAGPAVADLVGLRHVVVKVVDRLPAAAADADLGSSVSLEAAQAGVDFLIRRPTTLGPPDSIHLGSPPGGVTMRWTDPDVLVTQHPGELAGVIKTVLDGSRATPVQVLVRSGGSHVLPTTQDRHQNELVAVSGLWLTGPHVVTYVDEDGTVHAEPPRRAGNTLVWSDRGVVTRVEVDGPLRGALDLAASLRPPG
jgi:hypothetical protein